MVNKILSIVNKRLPNRNYTLLGSNVHPSFLAFLKESDKQDKISGRVSTYSIWKGKKEIQYCSKFHSEARQNLVEVSIQQWFEIKFCKECKSLRKIRQKEKLRGINLRAKIQEAINS